MNNALGALINSAGGTTATYAGAINLSGTDGHRQQHLQLDRSRPAISSSAARSARQPRRGINKVGADMLTITGS